MRHKDVIQAQLDALKEKMIQRPGEDDKAGMVGLLAALAAAKIQSLLLQEEFEEERDGISASQS